MIALDRIEGVGGRQHLERPADADLSGDAEAVHLVGELGDVEVGGGEPDALAQRWPGLEGNGTLIEPTVDEAREARAHGEDPVVGDRLDRSDAREAVVRLRVAVPSVVRAPIPVS